MLQVGGAVGENVASLPGINGSGVPAFVDTAVVLSFNAGVKKNVSINNAMAAQP